MTRKSFGKIFLVIVVLFTLYVYWENELLKSASERDMATTVSTNLSNKQLQYIEAIEYPLDNNMIFQCCDDDSVSLEQLSRLSHLCLYIDSHHCHSCWKDELHNLADWCDSVEFSSVPILIANNFSMRELRIIQSETDFRIYSIGSKPEFLCPLTKFNVPFYFVINQEGHVCSPYFPSKEDMGVYPKRYFVHARDLTKQANNKGLSEGKDILVLLNDNVKIGTIPYRKKVNIKFKMRNMGSRPCKVLECQPSCSCIMVDSFSTVIPPGEIGHVSITTVQNNKGSFQHSVRIHTDFMEKPYSVSFMGKCK